MVVLFALFLLSARTEASETSPGSPKSLLRVNSNDKSLSLLDPARLKMYHSYTFSYFSSGKTSGSLGIYTTTIRYRLSDPLSLTLSLNYLHQPLSVFQRNDLGIKNRIFPNFLLNYRPNSNFSFNVKILTFPHPYGLGNDEYRWGEYER